MYKNVTFWPRFHEILPDQAYARLSTLCAKSSITPYSAPIRAEMRCIPFLLFGGAECGSDARWQHFLRLRWKTGLFLKLCWIFLTKVVAESNHVSRVMHDSLLKLRWNSHDSHHAAGGDYSFRGDGRSAEQPAAARHEQDIQRPGILA
jgi:hypothetical protein